MRQKDREASLTAFTFEIELQKLSCCQNIGSSTVGHDNVNIAWRRPLDYVAYRP